MRLRQRYVNAKRWRVRCGMALAHGAAVRVIHRHRIGKTVFARVSELTYRDGQPLAVLTWIQLREVLAPCVCVQLDPAKLHPGSDRHVFRYDGVTADPRYAVADDAVAV
jgi:hypothetical protein